MYRQENRNHTLKSKEKGMKKTSQSLQKTRERDKRNRIQWLEIISLIIITGKKSIQVQIECDVKSDIS